jgi:hypothetical protein
MTVLRFGTDTDRVVGFEGSRFASADGRASQPVTPGGPLKLWSFAAAASGRPRGACSSRLEGFRGSEEVGDLMEVEAAHVVASRFGRIDTLKCGEARRGGDASRRRAGWSKHTRGGREPNDRAGRPRRGRRSREHRLESAFNGSLPGTDARLEQGSEVVGSRLTRGVPSDLAQTRARRC